MGQICELPTSFSARICQGDFGIWEIPNSFQQEVPCVPFHGGKLGCCEGDVLVTLGAASREIPLCL